MATPPSTASAGEAIIPGIGQLERQVIEAALVTTRPTSSHQERLEASLSLERWTAGNTDSNAVANGAAGASGVGIDTSCWETYINILRISFAPSDNYPTHPALPISPPPSRQPSNCSSASSSSSTGIGANIVEQIAYVSSPQMNSSLLASSSTSPSAMSPMLQQQIQREANGAKLLLVTLFATKIRREYSRLLIIGGEFSLMARRVYEELISSLAVLGNKNDDCQDNQQLMGALCSALAAVVVHLCPVPSQQASYQQQHNGLLEMIRICHTSIAASLGINTKFNGTNSNVILSPSVALRLLANIPTEVQSRKDLTLAEVEALLQCDSNSTGEGGGNGVGGSDGSIVSAVLEILHMALNGYIINANTATSTQVSMEHHDALLCSSLQSLYKWADLCTLSQLSQSLSSSSLFQQPQQLHQHPSILSQLVALLSTQSQQKQWSSAKHAQNSIMYSSDTLNACIANTRDFGTQSRVAAISSLLSSIPPPTDPNVQGIEFLVLPLKLSQHHQWEDATTSLSNLSCTLAKEEMEDVCTYRIPGSSHLIELLMQLQSHPQHTAAVPVLEVWLALQDVPVAERHSSLQVGRVGGGSGEWYVRLLEIILKRVAYPPNFVSWEEELDMEQAEFEEMRRLATDVLVGIYFLLRSKYLEQLGSVIINNLAGDSTSAEGNVRWDIVEAGLFCLCAVSREVCARVKSVSNATNGGRDSPVAADGEATTSGLFQIVRTVFAGRSVGNDGVMDALRPHPLILSGIANFIGCYSTVWKVSCPPQSMCELLSFLCTALSTPAAVESAGTSIRLVLIAIGPKLASAAKSSEASGADPTSSYKQISVMLNDAMESAISSGNAKVMAQVAEGCARVIVQLKDMTQARGILSTVAASTLDHARVAVNTIHSLSSADGNGRVNEVSGAVASQLLEASQALLSCLGVLREIIRFCDRTSSETPGEVHVLSDVLYTAWPVLNDIPSHPYCRSSDAVLSGLLSVHSQLLNAVPTLIAPHLNDIITFVVRAYEETFSSSCLNYISTAVESIGSEVSRLADAAGLNEQAKGLLFNQLLSHVSQCTFTHVTQTKRPNECHEVISSLFELTQRYLLFLPEALCQCPEFPLLFALASACLVECKGETDSTRATLVFLTQLIGWNIYLPVKKQGKIQPFASHIDNLLLHHGESIIKSCIGGLSGGSPQILWPSFSECLFSIMLHIVASSSPSSPSLSGSGEPNSILYNWIFSAMNDSTLGISQSMSMETSHSVIRILCSLAKEGGKSKPKAKMLLMDFGKICKGESTCDSLLAYSLAH